MIGLDSSVLIGALTSNRFSAGGTGASGGQGSQQSQSADQRRLEQRLQRASVDAPWRGIADLPAAERDSRILQIGRDVVNGRPPLTDAQRNAGGPTRADTQQLFAAWQSVDALRGLAALAENDRTPAAERAQAAARFAESIGQVRDFLGGMRLSDVIVSTATRADQLESRFALRRGLSSFTTDVLHTGDRSAPVAAWSGDVQFTITARAGRENERIIPIDLAEMGDQPRTMNSVVTFINGKLSAAGVLTRVAAAELGRAPPSAGSTTPGPQQWGLRVNGSAVEPVIFTAAPTGPAVTVTSSVNGAAQVARLREGGPQTRPLQALGQPARLDTDQAGGFTVRASAQGADGSTYLVGEATGPIDGSLAAQGQSDVVLTKMDAAGRRIWTRVLGATEAGQGFAVAVGADGRVAVAGAVAGRADPSQSSAGGRDSFVAVYDGNGREQWTRQIGSNRDDEAHSVAFGADGIVYLGGRTRSGANAAGWDGYLQAFGVDGAAGLERRFATAADDNITAIATASDGGLILAGQEGGRATLRKVTTDGQEVWSRTSVNLGGGAITSVQVRGDDILVAGAANDVSELGFGETALNSPGGGRDGFVMKLTDGAEPTIAWSRFIGAARADGVGAVTFHHDKVLVAGTETPPGAATRGFVAQLDLVTGDENWRQAAPGNAAGAPIGIAVQNDGASVLDRFGLPQGNLAFGDSQVLTQRSALKAGDHFFIRINGGAQQRVEIRADDTMSTLARRLNGTLGSAGDAVAVSASAGERLRIIADPGDRIEIIRGENGRDAARVLGLNSGMVAASAPSSRRSSTQQDAPRVLALEFNDTQRLTDAKGSGDVRRNLEAVQFKLRVAFDSLFETPADPLAQRREAAAQQPVDLRTRQQIAGYNAALARLSGITGG
jgi:hypothetical protein